MSLEVEEHDIQAGLRLIDASKVLTKNNKKVIHGFIDDAAAGLILYDNKPMTRKRQYKYIVCLRKLGEMLGTDFSKATKKDIMVLVKKINEMKVEKKADGKITKVLASEWTRYTYLVCLKRFFKWLQGENDFYPESVRWIHPHMEKRHDIEESQLLTHDDVVAMVNTTQYARDRAFLLFLYESGARIGEIMALTVGDFTVPDSHGAIMHIPQIKKNTVSRDIRIMASSAAISQWLNEHPDRRNKNSLLFCGIGWGRQGKSVVYNTFRKVINNAAGQAGIDKDTNPHHWRHSRATELGDKLPPASFCTYMGWRQGSREASTYIHKANTDREILKMHGIIKDENKKESFVPKNCPRCGRKNDAASVFCSGCSLGLDERSIHEYDRRRQRQEKTGFAVESVLDDPEELQRLIDKLNSRRDTLITGKK